MTKQRKYPVWICHDCGIKYCNGLSGATRQCATYHIDVCGCCGAEDVPCTEPRDYGHFKDWPLDPSIDPSPLPQTLGDLIEPCIQYFDFELVHRAMKAVSWWWISGQGADHIPTVEQLKKTAYKRLQEIVDNPSIAECGSGGLYACKLDDGLRLQFIFSQSDVYMDDFE